MLEIHIKVTGGELPDIGSAEVQRRLRGAAAGHVRKLLHDHLAARPGRSYWKEAAEATEVEASGGQYTVAVHQRGVALHYYGGTVKPTGRISSVTGKPIKRLLIPFDDSPLRKQKAELSELGIDPGDMFVLKKPARAILAAKQGSGVLMLGVLKTQQKFDADKTVLPTEEAMRQAGAEGANEAMNLLNL